MIGNGGATGNRTPIPWMQTTCSPVKLWPQERVQIEDFRLKSAFARHRSVQSEIRNLISEIRKVGLSGVEPLTSRLSGVRSNQI
jgi:hypothetical protein